ncbi:helix-turn-helix domain-containing protein [Mariniblastus sp.]|jgi:excisionase family DNA binding protein|nr:helix-turn-helix domain-containing protein [Mariniblastus sp.]
MSKDITNSQIYTLAEAAAYLKVSERTLWQLARDGEIPCFRVGKQYRFVRSQLRAWAIGEQSEPKPAG